MKSLEFAVRAISEMPVGKLLSVGYDERPWPSGFSGFRTFHDSILTVCRKTSQYALDDYVAKHPWQNSPHRLFGREELSQCLSTMPTPRVLCSRPTLACLLAFATLPASSIVVHKNVPEHCVMLAKADEAPGALVLHDLGVDSEKKVVLDWHVTLFENDTWCLDTRTLVSRLDAALA
ncbi:MAG: hypothetical protein JSS66_05580 [Armatimonadetes bacterium]|nr:hypothetical protein [Armatimonadota bacterium]